MQKLSNNTNSLVVFFVLKAFILSVLCIIIFSLLFSEIILKFDLGVNSENTFSIIVLALSAVITAYFSLSKIKNNGAFMGIISICPLIFYSLVNMIFNDNTPLFFIIKTIISICIGALFGIIRVNNNKKFKV